MIRTYVKLYAYVLKLAGRAIARRWTYLFLAPLVAIPYEIVMNLIGRMGIGIGGGLAAGLVLGLIQALFISFLIFVGRAIIEQRSLSFDDLIGGFTAFFNDVIWVLIVLEIAEMVLGAITPWAMILWYVAFGLFPLLEIIGLTTVGGLSVYEAAWRFVRRDAVAWYIGNAPLILLVPLSFSIGNIVTMLLVRTPIPAVILLYLPGVILNLIIFTAFIYRGVLFLTLDNTSARARAERFGGAQGLR